MKEKLRYIIETLILIVFTLGVIRTIITLNWVFLFLEIVSIAVYIYVNAILISQHNKKDTIYAGSLGAIIYELKHGDFFTVLDEILHVFCVLDLFSWRYRFCNWAHTRKEK